MIKLAITVTLLLFAAIQAEIYSPFPQGKIAPELFSHYYPQIMEEVAKEFARQDDGRTWRDTREYGYSFFRMCDGDFSFEEPPQFLQELGALVCEQFGREAPPFDNIILSLYEEGFHLEPHIDAYDLYRFNSLFYFDENVYGLIVESDPTGHLYFVKYEGPPLPPLNLEPVYALVEEPGAIFCLTGEYRKVPFHHAVSTVSNRRISITFRNVIKVVDLEILSKVVFSGISAPSV